MLQLVAMDLDGTLAPFNGAIQPKTIELLNQLQKEGVKLVITSGKPASHISGLVRQANLQDDVIIMGDNGGIIWFNHEFPPKDPFIMTMTKEAALELEKIRNAILTKFGENVWVQPNRCTFSLFSRGIDIEEVFEFCDQLFETEKIQFLKNFKTGGALDVIPKTIDKGIGLKYIQEKLNIPIEDTAVIGDGANDVPMFLRGKIRITFPQSAKIFVKLVPKVVPDIDRALEFLIGISRFEKSSFLEMLE